MEWQRQRGAGVVWFILLVIGLAAIAVFIAPHIFGTNQAAQTAQITNDLNTIYAALDQYNLDNGIYPSTDQGLEALVVQPISTPVPQYWKSGGYLEALPMDPWGQPYQYTNDEEVLRVFSYGSAGENGGTEIDRSNLGQNQNNQ